MDITGAYLSRRLQRGSIAPHNEVTIGILNVILWEHKAYDAVLEASIYINVDIKEMNVAASFASEDLRANSASPNAQPLHKK
ncbi:uncharacterized protein N7479_007836 [Penicillium vulpinum]|uniref:uncharacterized protein n=1 Tax=Penicillium vulpinum TaxID=29845 RepID=UPI00254720C5|nr:uncharacterized protein N7479_007836 [Penicillium vulpinum]KAJ5960686.1 hypothetical protein N7479_007836 [Penicillium vulpinum]